MTAPPRAMSRAATIAGIAAFVLVEGTVAFGSAIVASIRCCASVAGAWPGDGAAWATVAIFAVVMTVPAALIGLGSAMIVEGARRAFAALRRP
ncbi:hypothetical protein M9980_09920 [Sphingomonas donggukensis]|uniref:Uncharacterized protein n=1 Tax=Sphingomonas donggukensis TaxID=2949093 RepID=A0ABY4TT41_9SPHN|nr:hypothetical protein [Sphingomonas donggukensis]URW74881.1 hypothetical protein M9980_09920 [Sphingomonas donggukensis]